MIKFLKQKEHDDLMLKIENLENEVLFYKDLVEREKDTEIGLIKAELATLKKEKDNLVLENRLLKIEVNDKPMRNIGKTKDILINIQKIKPKDNIYSINKNLDKDRIQDFFKHDQKESFIYITNYYFLDYTKSQFFERTKEDVTKMFNRVFIQKDNDRKFYETFPQAKEDYIKYLTYKIDYFCNKNFSGFPTSNDLIKISTNYNKIIERINVDLESIGKETIPLINLKIRFEPTFHVKKLIELNEYLIKLSMELVFLLNRENSIQNLLDISKRKGLEDNYIYKKLESSLKERGKGRFEDYRQLYYFVEGLEYEYQMYNIIKDLGYKFNLHLSHNDNSIEIYGHNKRIQVKNLNSNDYISYSNSHGMLDKYKNKLQYVTKEKTKIIWFNSLKINTEDFQRFYKEQEGEKFLIV